MEMVLAMLGVFVLTGLLVDKINLGVYCLLTIVIMLIITITRLGF